MEDAADHAAAAALELASARRLLADPARRATAALDFGPGGAAGGGGPAAGGAAGGDVAARLRQSAAAAGLSDGMSSIDFGDPARIGDTDQREMKAFLRFDALTLEELTRFLYHLSAADPDARAHTIELGPPGCRRRRRGGGNCRRRGRAGAVVGRRDARVRDPRRPGRGGRHGPVTDTDR
jgi:hypothetical protein